MWDKINKQSEILLNQCLEKKLTVTTAESCTGGMIASSIVSISGSSTIFKSSVVTYSNDMKSKILKIHLNCGYEILLLFLIEHNFSVYYFVL